MCKSDSKRTHNIKDLLEIIFKGILGNMGREGGNPLPLFSRSIHNIILTFYEKIFFLMKHKHKK